MMEVSDVFIRRDLPLLTLFLSFGVFGAWLGARDRYVDRWLGGALIVASALGVGAIALGLAA